MKITQKGITLIELVIAIAIIGILAAVAIPAYQENVSQGRRGDGQAALLGLAQAMERQFTLDGTYTTVNGDDDPDPDITAATAPTIYADEAPLDGSAKFYDLRVMRADSSTYTIRAIPKGPQAQDGFLELRSSGFRGWDRDNSGALSATEDCWNKSC